MDCHRGGAGFFPIAPGTAGSAVGFAVVLGLAQLPLHGTAAIAVLAAASLVLFAVGVWAAGKAEDYFGRVDPGQVVMDEVVGQMLTFLLFPMPPGNGCWAVSCFFEHSIL